MSDLILPPGLVLPPKIRPLETPEEHIPFEERGKSLPEPTGWQVNTVEVTTIEKQVSRETSR
jgi:hypothetical protein